MSSISHSQIIKKKSLLRNYKLSETIGLVMNLLRLIKIIVNKNSKINFNY